MDPLYFKVSIVQPYQAMAESKPGMLIWELKIVLKTFKYAIKSAGISMISNPST